jgi:hypothetical protein
MSVCRIEQLMPVQSGEYGDYYNVWYSIAARASVEIAAWTGVRHIR